MKKRFLGLALVLTAFAANAQTAFAANAQPETDQVALNVKLHPIQTIVVNAANVDLEYKTKDDYANGVTVSQGDHLTVYSTGGFTVNVKSETPTLTSLLPAAAAKSISSSDILITSAAGTTNSLAGAAYETDVPLTTTGAQLIKSTTGGVNKNFNVTYSHKDNGDLDTFVNKYFKDGDNPTVYTTNVIYEIVAS
ncbi:hypothetical protein EIZ47_02825 [Chryseobacterium lacus]|uniref:Peptidoglycan-binding protein LysM n=2 Tax=Chryseobacterium lacus TaxID=2058346 RepID=A0A368N1X8_9FLAO|nr:hypothetical protein DQ356_02865 [Chryseobacterium lacus]RST29095.1 hypothetical protein EIZ47_02825 [Chryseobacterium lacus]